MALDLLLHRLPHRADHRRRGDHRWWRDGCQRRVPPGRGRGDGQLALTTPLTPPAPRIPFTIDFSSSAYFHNSDDGLLFGLADPDQQDGFDTTWTPEWLDLFREVVRHRAPALADMETAGGWAGLYEVTPDHNALIGRAGELRNFLYATGFSGHGFLQAPAVGEIVRDLYLGRTPFIDVSPLGVDRFRSGAEVRPEAHVV